MRLGAGRTILAVIAGYVTNALLVGVTEAMFRRSLDTPKYFIVDLVTQIAATIIAGCLCCLIANEGTALAAIGMAMLGLVIGSASLVMSWNIEPHWYGITLLFVYAPCVWTGYALVVRHHFAIAPKSSTE